MLINKYEKKISHSILPIDLIKPYPNIDDRVKWDKTDEIIKSIIIERAKRYNDIALNPISCTLLLNSVASGNSDSFNKIYKKRINALIALTLAECIENIGNYIEPILNISWAIMDMAIWYNPLTSISGKPSNLNTFDATEYLLDLPATEIGYALSYSYFLLKTKFDEIDINIGKRFKFEIDRRIIKPFNNESCLNHMVSTQKINSNKLICIRNILLPVLIFSENYETRHEAAVLSMRIADTIITTNLNNNHFSFYNSLMKYLSSLYMASGGVFDIFDEKFIENLETKIINSESKFNANQYVYLSQNANHTNNNELFKLILKDFNTKEYISMLKTDISIDSSLFIIFNYDFIISGFYI